MTAGRAARDGDERRVAAVVGDVLARPRNGSLYRDKVFGPGGLGGQRIVRRDAHPTPSGQMHHQRKALLLLVADHPTAAVHLDQDGTPDPRFTWLVDVEPVPASAVTDVVDVGDAVDAGV